MILELGLKWSWSTKAESYNTNKLHGDAFESQNFVVNLYLTSGVCFASGSVGNSTTLRNSEIISFFLMYVSGAFSQDWGILYAFFFQSERVQLFLVHTCVCPAALGHLTSGQLGLTRELNWCFSVYFLPKPNQDNAKSCFAIWAFDWLHMGH